MKSRPSRLSILSLLIVYALIRSTRLATIITSKSTQAIYASESGLIRAAPPTMRRMFAMLEPMTFPSAIWLRPFLAATMQVASSGSDVPAAMIVIAMNFSERLRY